MRIDLTAMGRAKGKRRVVTVRDIVPARMFATDLYRTAYEPIVAAWLGASRRILSEYERSLSTITRDSPADIEAAIEAGERTTSALYLLITPRLRDWALKVEQWHRGKWTAAILSATTVDLSTMLGSQDVRETLETVIARNVGLVKDVSAEARARMATAVYDGLRNRAPAREVAKQLREAVDMSRKRSIRIASDQLSKITSSLADERRAEVGLTYWKWMHSGKLHPRADHVARDGKLYSDNPKGVGNKVDGKTAMAPPEDRPGQKPFCGCRSLSVIDFSDI